MTFKTYKRNRALINFIIMLCTVIILSSQVAAVEDSGEMSEKWRTLRDYPLRYGSEELREMPFEKQLATLNPPQDVLEGFTTNELAELMLRYPLLDEMLGVFDFDMPSYFSRLETQSTIFSELTYREGGNRAVLEAINGMTLDVGEINAAGSLTAAFMKSASARAEVFYRNFVMVYWDRFSEEERNFFQDVHKRRTEEYYANVKDENARKFFAEIPINEVNSTDDFMAAGALRKRWYEKTEYPITRKDPSWDQRSFDELNWILTPPDDVLQSLSLEEMTELVLCYPFLREYEKYDSSRQFFNVFFERNCVIFKKLLSRNGGISSLLNAYEANELNVEALNANGLNAEDDSVVREVFLCKFVDFYSAWRFKDEDIAQYKRIYVEKKKTYDKIENQEVKMAFETRLSTQAEEDVSPSASPEPVIAHAAETVSRKSAWNSTWILVTIIGSLGIMSIIILKKKH